MDFLNDLIVALLASSAVGMVVSFVIQLGKLFFPKFFPDESADNWRLGLIVLTAVVVWGLRLAGVLADVAAVEAIATSIATLGATLMPLLLLLANVIAKATYKDVLKGVQGIGISYTEDAQDYG